MLRRASLVAHILYSETFICLIFFICSFKRHISSFSSASMSLGENSVCSTDSALPQIMLVCSTPSLSLLYSKTKYDSALQKFDSALQKKLGSRAESDYHRAESDYHRAESDCRRAESDYRRAESNYHRAESSLFLQQLIGRAESI